MGSRALTTALRSARVPGLFALASILFLLARPLPAASEYRCEEGGKPNKVTKKCDCPPGKVESTDAKDVSRCIAAPKPSASTPPGKPTTAPPPTPTPTTTTSGPAPIPPILSNPGGKCPAGMALIPGGTYTLSDTKALAVVADACLDGTEVTVSSYETCMSAGKCGEPLNYKPLEGHDQLCNWKKPARAHHPINCVDWNQATAYCAFVGKRLPTEEEWEWAARGGVKGWNYPWGDDAPGPRACWAGEGNALGKASRTSTCTIGSFAIGANPQGVVDLAGNVFEWTSSKLDASSKTYVTRGGSWYDLEAKRLTVGLRDDRMPMSKVSTIGFRCARAP